MFHFQSSSAWQSTLPLNKIIRIGFHKNTNRKLGDRVARLFNGKPRMFIIRITSRLNAITKQQRGQCTISDVH